MNPDLPAQMTAVVLKSYGGAAALRTEQLPVPHLEGNQVLIKIAASPINPSDLSFLDGNYGIRKPLPVVPGLEASGTVVAVGSGMMGRYLLNKRVACLAGADGVWADYVVTKSSLALPLNDDVELEQGAMSIVNPVTAIALVSIAKEGGYKTVVQTAAASALGQMIVRLARTEGISVINIVRREEQAELLRAQGATIILNSEEKGFDEQLAAVCDEQEAHLALDAVTGRLSLRVLKAMPDDGKIIVYGGLSQEAVQSDPGDLIFRNKRVEGFWLTHWLRKKNIFQGLSLWRRAQKLLLTDLRSDIRARYSLQQAQTAVEDYRAQMTGGKVLLVPEA